MFKKFFLTHQKGFFTVSCFRADTALIMNKRFLQNKHARVFDIDARKYFIQKRRKKRKQLEIAMKTKNRSFLKKGV